MKRNWILLSLSLLISLSFITISCSDDEGGTKVYELSGMVTLADQSIADGAIVSLSNEPNGADIAFTTVCDMDGKYSFMNLKKGTYYINASFEPGNNNNLKSGSTVILRGAEMEIEVKDEMIYDLVLTGAASTGTGMIDLTDGWVYDATHSNIGFEFPYDAANAVFNGLFITSGVDVFKFDEANPEAMELKAWVDLTSGETGAPSLPCGHGRDGITGCMVNYFKVEKDAADTITAFCTSGETTSWPNEEKSAYSIWDDGTATTYQKQSAVIDDSGVALLEATSVVAYGDGYKATCDFTFAGVKKSVDMYFTFIDGYFAETDGVQTKQYSSIYAWFEFAALDDYGISSGHLGDGMVKVNLGAQFNKDLTQ